MPLPFLHHPLYIEELNSILSTPDIRQLSSKTVLITGTTGMLGTQLVDALLHANSCGASISVIAVGRSENKAHERLATHFSDPHFRFLCQSVVEPFPADITADYIIPLASSTHPLAYSRSPITTMETILLGARHALDLAHRSRAVVLFPSSVEIYGNNPSTAPFVESSTGQLDLSTSRASYTEAKRAAEALCQSYAAEKGVQIRIARLCRVFGPTLLPDDSKASSQFIHAALKHDDIVLKSNGSQQFSYIYAADAVAALLHILLHGSPATAYNISNPACDVSLKTFASSCAEAVGTRVVFDLPSDSESKGYSIATSAILDSSRLQKLGWKPRYPLQEALTRTLTLLAIKP